MSSRDKFRPKQRTPLRQRSDRRAEVMVKRNAAQVEAWGPRPWPCRFAAFSTSELDDAGVARDDRRCYGDVNGHEIRKRSRFPGDANLLDVKGQVPLCDFHNGYVEDEPKIAEALGLSVSSEV